MNEIMDRIARRLQRELQQRQEALYARFLANTTRPTVRSIHEMPPMLPPTGWTVEPWHHVFRPPRPVYVLVSDPSGLGDPVVDWDAES